MAHEGGSGPFDGNLEGTPRGGELGGGLVDALDSGGEHQTCSQMPPSQQEEARPDFNQISNLWNAYNH